MRTTKIGLAIKLRWERSSRVCFSVQIHLSASFIIDKKTRSGFLVKSLTKWALPTGEKLGWLIDS